MATEKGKQFAVIYLQTLQEDFPICNRKNCGCRMIPILVRYEDHGVINNEFECPRCNKVKKDPILAEQRKQQYLARKGKQGGKYGKSR